ncbi:flagellar FliJ family protein [Peptococcaceae bacterium]|nr:flagellar FliJ family protein [Peptococcaceae bacterium]
MKKFKFKLEPLFIKRKTEEKEKLMKQKNLEMIYNERVKIKEEIEDEICKCISDMCKRAVNESCDFLASDNANKDVWQRLVYVENLKSKMVTNENQIKKIEQELDRARIDAVNASKERMIIEKLKELKEAEYKKQLKKAEDKKIDEIAITMYSRRIKAEGLFVWLTSD